MCWNAEISLSTFIFGTAGIIIGYLNKVLNIADVLFLFTIVLMQLVEFFIWSYPNYNTLLSMLGIGLIIIQPIAAGLMVPNKWLYYGLYGIWLLFFLNRSIDFSTTVSARGHLKWNWLQVSVIHVIIWSLFVFIAMYYNGSRWTILFALILIIISWLSYKKDGSWGSIYCSFINLIFIVIIFKAFAKHYCILS